MARLRWVQIVYTYFLLLFLPGLSNQQRLPQQLWISFHHFVPSVTPSTFSPVLSISLRHESFHRMFCLPLRVSHGTGASSTLPNMCLSLFIVTCMYHFSIFSIMLFFSVMLTFSMMLYSSSLTPLSLVLSHMKGWEPEWSNSKNKQKQKRVCSNIDRCG